ncbi:MAG: hypothetical protein AVDCRST_MAG18-2553 [uncultured Thermomicrobiales bacterium]|uniref:DUF2076 domain-containing protein n=1 Tax=uncultured Thermomicrobiales bacterium TaxID=1645740 RepID=A0A6J4VKA5_9BACT|nr:MAG: hypothetical protein AVDCRST_MAG18-2553 [uncultured Thermomicrobiales bacterium]
MGFLRRLFGGGDDREQARQAPMRRSAPGQTADEQAVERYRYMLRTAPPEAIEQAHEEAFARLTPEQRRLALDELTKTASPQERAGASDDPRSLARLATRAEVRQPGTLERSFGGVGMGGGGIGMGGMIAGSLLGSVAGTFIGTAIAQQFFDNDTGFGDGGSGDSAGGETLDAPQDGAGAEPLAAEDPGFDDAGFDFGGDMGGGEA